MTKPKLDPDRRFASRITPEQAAQVRADHAAGKTITEIARALGVARSSVRMVIDGRSHKVQIPEAELEVIFDEMSASTGPTEP